MAYRFLLVDVFTDTAFGGNQLAVFPDATGIEERLLQPIARELNFTETTFVFPSRAPERLARLRIFTPDAEVPYAGHPVIGTAFALEREGALKDCSCDVVFELEGGDVPVHLHQGGDGRLLQATMTQQRPVFLGESHRTDTVAEALGLDPADIAITGLPCEIVSTGLPFHMVPVGSLEAVESIQLHPRKLEEITHAVGFSDLFVFTFETVDPTATVHCRMFAPSFGIPEDPATGSASGCLGAYLVKNRVVPVSRLVRIESEQGLEMGRPSRVTIEVETQDRTIVAVRVGGGAMVVGEGTVWP
jgi:trans-2,3-dihydro-3-hydroxyanthranilate isomerase